MTNSTRDQKDRQEARKERNRKVTMRMYAGLMLCWRCSTEQDEAPKCVVCGTDLS